MTNTNFDVVAYIEDRLSGAEQYLVNLETRYDTVVTRYELGDRKPMFVIGSDSYAAFVGEVDGSNLAMRHDATDCKIFRSKKEAQRIAGDFVKAGVNVVVFNYMDALAAEIERVNEELPELNAALANANKLAA